LGRGFAEGASAEGFGVAEGAWVSLFSTEICAMRWDIDWKKVIPSRFVASRTQPGMSLLAIAFWIARSRSSMVKGFLCVLLRDVLICKR
jgi:hypothetical protein